MKALTSLLTVMTTTSFLWAQEPGQPEVDVTSYETRNAPAVRGDEGPVRFPSNVPLDDSAYLSPMPVYSDKPEHIGPVEAVIYDTETGVETRIPVVDSAIATQGSVVGRAIGREIRESLGRSFGPPTQINSGSLSSWPWRAHGRMWFSQGGFNYVCSGTMIDARNFITAGHCVHEGSGGGWSTNISFAPGWDGDDDNFGSANGTTMVTWTGWTNNGNWGGDQALVRLDRPVGFLTGWMGYGYNNNNGWWAGEFFDQTGYPGGCFAGAPNALYYAFGDWDEVNDRVVEADYTPNAPCWIGGMSGGGIYWRDAAQNRFVHANNSHGWGAGLGITSRYGATRMTQNKFDYYNDTWIPGSYPDLEPDYLPLNVTVDMGGNTITAGDNLVDMDYVVANSSNFNPIGIQAYSTDVYLSTNDNISEFDTMIQSHLFNWNFGAKTSVSVDVGGSVTIPANTSAGTYWVGVILNAVDANTGNNDSDGWDAAEITVVEPPPLWPNLPLDFQSLGAHANYMETFDGLGGILPSDMATNRLDATTRAFDPEAWTNVGNLAACLSPFSGGRNVEMGLIPGSTNYHQVANGFVMGIDGGGATELFLDFMAVNFGEESNLNDGVFISGDGDDWAQVYGDWSGIGSSWELVDEVPLHGNGVDISGDFYLLFAQEDNFPYMNLDGIGIDDVRVHRADPVLSVANLVAGQIATVSISGGTPFSRNFVSWSLGGGAIPSVWGPISLDLPYHTLPVIDIDFAGDGSVTGQTQPGTSGLPVYFQGLEVPSLLVTNPLVVVTG